jgi:ribosome-associated protein
LSISHAFDFRSRLYTFKTAMNTTTEFTLRGDHITLDALLKATGLASSGGEAKQHITAGMVLVNSEVDTRRGRKLRAGDVVTLGSTQVLVQAPQAAPPQADPQ